MRKEVMRVETYFTKGQVKKLAEGQKIRTTVGEEPGTMGVDRPGRRPSEDCPRLPLLGTSIEVEPMPLYRRVPEQVRDHRLDD